MTKRVVDEQKDAIRGQIINALTPLIPHDTTVEFKGDDLLRFVTDGTHYHIVVKVKQRLTHSLEQKPIPGEFEVLITDEKAEISSFPLSMSGEQQVLTKIAQKIFKQYKHYVAMRKDAVAQGNLTAATELHKKYDITDMGSPSIKPSDSEDRVLFYFHGTYEMTPEQADKVLAALMDAGVI